MMTSRAFKRLAAKVASRHPTRPKHRGVKHADTMTLALHRATALTAQEVEQIIGRAETAFDALRQGQATYLHLCCLGTTCNLGLIIEKQGVVRGMQQPMSEAEQAIQELVRQGQSDPSGWKPPVMRSAQLLCLKELLVLHRFQLEQLSYNEYQRAWTTLKGRARSMGVATLPRGSE